MLNPRWPDPQDGPACDPLLHAARSAARKLWSGEVMEEYDLDALKQYATSELIDLDQPQF